MALSAESLSSKICNEKLEQKQDCKTEDLQIDSESKGDGNVSNTDGKSTSTSFSTPSTTSNNTNNNSNNNNINNNINPANLTAKGVGNQQLGDRDSNISASEIWSRLLANPATKHPENTLKLFQNVLQDGLLDSILPYVVSSLNLSSNPSKTFFPLVQTTLNKSTAGSDSIVKKTPIDSQEKEKNKEASKSTKVTTKAKVEPKTCEEEMESVSESILKDSEEKEETSPNYLSDCFYDKGPPIVIHVCDEAHGLRQDFTCSRDLLINYIGYFAEVTAGQRLEDVDISVHCDVSIFDWLLKWVKKQDCPTAKQPVLEPKNAISILISADFLKMSPLAEEVLKYVHNNTNRILEAQVNMSCLTDSLLTKLARIFTHWELENLKDPRDRLQNKLYARFVQMLCETNPLPSKGIFRTAAYIYRCSDCGKIINRSVERLIDCLSSNTCITTSGIVYYIHSRDINWSLTEHVKLLKTELKSWRLVYWRLWGQVHFLPCSTCGAIFPGSEMKLCRYHRLDPSYGAENLSPLISGGGDTYPCCGARTLRFSPLSLRNGCQFTEHTVQLTRRHNDIWGPIPQVYDDLLTFQVLICVEPRTEETVFQKVIWRGVSIIPASRMEKSLLDRSWLAEHRGEKGLSTVAEIQPVDAISQKPEEEVLESAQDLHKHISDCESETSDDEEEGGKRRTLTPKMKTMLLRKAARAKRTVAYEIASEPGWRWDTTRSTRYNQDAQRDRELRVFRELTAWLALAPPTAPDTGTFGSTKARHRVDKNKKENTTLGPDPGTFYRLEAEFKEKFGTHEKSHGSNHPGGAFRAKVQAISRIKMRLRNRTAFSATR